MEWLYDAAAVRRARSFSMTHPARLDWRPKIAAKNGQERGGNAGKRNFLKESAKARMKGDTADWTSTI